jgi:hypothetical protein
MAVSFLDVKSVSGAAGARSLGAFAVNVAIGDVIVTGQAMFSGTSVPASPISALGNVFTLLGSTPAAGSTRIAIYMSVVTVAGAETIQITSNHTNIAGVGWLIRGLSSTPYNSDIFTMSQGTGTSLSVGPTTLTPFPGSVYLVFGSTESTSDAGTPVGWNTTGANGFTAGMATASKKLDWSANEDIDSAYKISNGPETGVFPSAISNVRSVGVILSFSPPRVASPVSALPATIATIGGDTVTITGTNFGSWVTGVTIGGVAATNVLVVNSTTITCTAPAHAVGAVDIVVTAADGNGTIVAGTTYAVKPVPTSVTPQAVLAAGGTTATIRGSGFQNGATVDFGGTPATGVVVVDANTITCTIPAHAAGQTVITVTNP